DESGYFSVPRSIGYGLNGTRSISFDANRCSADSGAFLGVNLDRQGVLSLRTTAAPPMGLNRGGSYCPEVLSKSYLSSKIGVLPVDTCRHVSTSLVFSGARDL